MSCSRKFTFVLPLIGTLMLVAGVFASTETFTGNDGGYTVLDDGAMTGGGWQYDGTSTWLANGEAQVGSPTSSRLTSTPYTATSTGPVTLSVVHRYSIEGELWDGAQIQTSVNGGTFTAVTDAAFSQGGYGTHGPLIGNHDLTGAVDAYNGDSPNYADPAFITSVADLGALNAGDALEVRFLLAWDEFTKGQEPNWQIDSVTIVPEPSSLLLGALSLLGIGYLRRRR